MVERNPWEEFETPAVQPAAPASQNPWEVFSQPQPEAAKPTPAPAPASNPWEVAQLDAARSEEGTLFGRGKAETALGELGAGIQQGARQVAATPYALAALGLEGFDYLTGYDNNDLAQAFMQDAVAIATGGAQRGIAKWEDLSSDPMSWLRYVSGVTGEAIPFVASIMAGGGAPSLLGKLMARKGIDGATRAGILASMPAQIAGATATSTAIETGATAQELYEATKEIRPAASLIAGTAKGSLEAVFPLMLSRQLGLTGAQGIELANRLFTRAGAAQLGRGVATEGATEYLQEEIDLTTRAYLDENFGFLSPEANSRRINALLAGATGGGVLQAGVQLAVGRDPVAPAPDWTDVVKAANDTPLIMGHGLNELPVSGPEDIFRTAPVGGPVTVTASTALEQMQFLAEDPVLSRGLYAPVVQGVEPQFGTQEEAVNDHSLLGGQGYMRLDPGKVKRGDLSSAVQDLPDHVADPRIEYTDPTTAQQAQEFLKQAVQHKNNAARSRAGTNRMASLDKAQVAYRQAMNLGVRVEPLSDGQVVLRDANKLAQVAQSMQQLTSQESQAGLKETRKLPGGKKFYVFEKGIAEDEEGKTPAGQRLDLEKVNPDDMTALPTPEFNRRLLATHAVSRKGDLGRARAMGIRFVGAAAKSRARQQNLLRALVRLTSGMSSTMPFEKLPAPMADRFMKIVELGLRLDVTPGSDKFAVLDQVGQGVFVPRRDNVTGDVRMDQGLARIVKQRTRREREPRVSPDIQFESEDLATLFFGQLHGNTIQRILAGKVNVMPYEVKVKNAPSRGYEMQRSPLASLLRSLVKEWGIPTDYVIEVVSPQTLPDKGVQYVEKTIALPGGKRSEPRSVIQVNPWFYAQPTVGDKKLTKPADRFVIPGGPILMFGDMRPSGAAAQVIYKGQRTTLGEVTALPEIKKKKGWPLLSFTDISLPGTFIGMVEPNDVQKRYPTAVPINNPMAADVIAYQKYKDAPVPKYTFTRIENTNEFEGRTFYHGTKQPLNKLSEADVHGRGSVENLFGSGLYLTDNPDVAASYAKGKGIGPAGKVLAAKLKKVNLIDLEQPLPDDVAEVFRSRLSEYLYEEELDQALSQPGRGVFDALRQAMADTGEITTSEALEIFGDIAGALGNLGYDGFSHQGGQNTTNNLGPHNVVVLFDNIGVKDGKEVGKGPKTLLEDVEYSAEKTAPPPVPKYTPNVSTIGNLAKGFGTGDSKLYVEDDRAAEFYADVAVAISQSVVTFEWGRTEHSMQEALRDAWRREMHLAQGTRAEMQMAKVVPHPLLDRVLGQKRTGKSLQFEFEEWLVQQTARYMTQKPQGLIGSVAKWLDKVGTRVKNVIEALWQKAEKAQKPFGLDPNKGAPHEVVLRWLDQLSLRGVGKTVPEAFLEQGTRDALMDSLNRNQERFKSLGLDQYVIAAPERASGRQVRELIKWLPKDNPDRAKLEALVGMADKQSTTMDWLLGIHQMADRNPHIKGLRDYVSLTRAMENSAVSWSTMADGRLREALKLGKEQMQALSNVLFDLDQMTYLDQEKLAKGEIKGRWPTAEELLAIVQKHKMGRDAFNVYVEIRNDFLQFLTYLEEVSVQQATETISDPAELAAKVAEIQGETAQIKSKPYFPHMRFGQYTLTVKGPKNKTLFFGAYPSLKLRSQAAVGLEREFTEDLRKGDVKIVENEMSPTAQQYQGLPAYALQNVIRRLGLNEEEALLTPQQKKDKAALEAMAVQSLPTESLRKHLAGRRNVPGWSSDSMRAYANYFGRAARFMARVEYGSRLEGAIRDVQDSGGSLTRDKRTRIADFMREHFDAQMQPAADWAELRAAGFLWYFAFAPASALINLFQVPMVSVPYLAGKFGDMRTMGRVTAAYGQATKEFFGWLSGSRPVEDSVKNEALEEAHFSRLVDDGYATELAALSQGPVLQATIPGTAVARGLRRFAQWGTLPFQLAERINRSVTFRAAYDLAIRDNTNSWIDEVMLANKPEADQLRIDRGWDERHLRAYMAAADAVRKSQFEYGRWSRPKLMEGPRGVLLMFKTYLQNMLYFMFKSDRGTQMRFMLLMLFTAGVMGMPGGEDAAEVAKWLAKMFGMRFDFEHTLREMMTKFGAGEWSDVMLHGASREGFGVSAAMNGLGIPAPTIDLSASLSMGRIIPGLKPLLNPGSSMSQDAVGEIVSEVAGPVLGVPFDMYQSLLDKSLPAEDPKRWERAMPRALKSMSKASRYLAEQRERDRTGATIYRFDPNDMNDQMDILLGVGLGFQPTGLRQTWDYTRAQKEVQDYWRGQRQVLMSELHRAHRLRDKEGKRDALDAIRRFNEEAPDRALKITGESMRQSLQARTRVHRMKEKDVPREKYLRGVSKEIQTLYPEVMERRKVPHQRLQ